MVHVEMRAGDETRGVSLDGGILRPGRWGHVAFSIDQSGGARLTVDGAEADWKLFRGAKGVNNFC